MISETPPRCPQGPPRPAPPPGPLSPTTTGSPAAEPDAAQAAAPVGPPKPAKWDQMTKLQKKNWKKKQLASGGPAPGLPPTHASTLPHPPYLTHPPSLTHQAPIPPRCPNAPPRPVPSPGLLLPTTTGSPAAEPEAAQAAALTPDPPRPAHWDKMTKQQRHHWKRHHKPKERKGGA